jgi:Fur family ferric uptake transcriptional regulator
MNGSVETHEGPTVSPGMRRTRQRQLVWEALRELGPHHTADDILAYLRSRYQIGLPKSTVYRALDTMLETGDATACRLDDAGLRYEIAETPHAHAICTGCGRVFHIDDLALKVAAQELVGMHDFLPLRADLTVRGLCATCRVDAPAPDPE